MTIHNFDSDREYEDWEERSTQERMLDNYFGEGAIYVEEDYK